MFGRNLKAKREAKGWSQEYLAGVVDCGVRLMGFYEQGIRVPNVYMAFAIAKALGCTVDDLLAD